MRATRAPGPRDHARTDREVVEGLTFDDVVPATGGQGAPTMPTKGKALATKTLQGPPVWNKETWTIRFGKLKRGRGRPRGAKPLFEAVGEKIPIAALEDVRRHAEKQGISTTGIYVAHDSMGGARYIGRANIFSRLRARLSAQKLELRYFSFYVGLNKTHERELETVLIRACGAQLYFNTRKKREDIQAGDVRDYEAGTQFYERQYKKGRRAARRKND
jgi:hypothetical protein